MVMVTRTREMQTGGLGRSKYQKREYRIILIVIYCSTGHMCPSPPATLNANLTFQTDSLTDNKTAKTTSLFLWQIAMSGS